MAASGVLQIVAASLPLRPARRYDAGARPTILLNAVLNALSER
jgi:hypothetical protein